METIDKIKKGIDYCDFITLYNKVMDKDILCGCNCNKVKYLRKLANFLQVEIDIDKLANKIR